MTDTRPPALAIGAVAVRYGPIAALDGVDLTVRAGERVALVGPSGAGKSSLLGVCSGLVTATAGTVEVLGTPLDTLDRGVLGARRRRAHRRRVGVIGQHLDLALPLRVVHNVNAGRLGSWSTARSLWSLVWPTGRAEVAAVLDRLGLRDRLMARTDELSGGERQRVAVARVVRQQPDLVLADEPTSAVDPRLSDMVMALLCDPAAPWTLVVSLHDPDLARRHVDRLIGVSGGRIAFDLPAGDVSDDRLRDLYRGEEPGAP